MKVLDLPALAGIEVAHRYHIPYINTNGWSDVIREKGYPEVFNPGVFNSRVAIAVADTMKSLGAKNVVAFCENTDYGVGLQKRFFGYFLKGERNGWDKQPRVQLNVRHPGERFVIRHEDDWPIPRTQWTKFHLAAEGHKLVAAPSGSGPGLSGPSRTTRLTPSSLNSRMAAASAASAEGSVGDPNVMSRPTTEAPQRFSPRTTRARYSREIGWRPPSRSKAAESTATITTSAGCRGVCSVCSRSSARTCQLSR